MSMKLRKIVALVLVVSLFSTFFVGCTEKQSDEKKTNVDIGGKSEEGKDNEVSNTFDKKFKYTVNMLDADSVQNELLDYYTEKYNIEFDIIPVTWGDWREKTRLWISSGDMPDIMYWDLKNYQLGEFRRWAEQGAFKEIPEFGSKYPNLQKIRETQKSDDYFKVDGKHYSWHALGGGAKYDNVSDQSFYYRKDWAEKLGMAKDEYTWDEMVELAKAFVEKDPGENGTGKTHGIGMIGWGWPIALVEIIDENINRYYLKDGKYVWGAEQPEALEAVKITKQLYKENVLWQDQIVAKNNDAENKYIAGQLGIYYTNPHVGEVSRMRNEIVKANPGIDREKAFAPLVVKNPDNKMWAIQGVDYWSATVFNPKLSDEKLERILTAWDWLATDEGFEFMTKGLKGVHWDMEGDKVKYLTDTPIQGKDIGLFKMVRLTEGYALEDPLFPEEDRKTVLDFKARRQQDDLDLKEVDYDLYFFNAKNYDKYGALYPEIKDKVVNIMVSPNDVEQEWNEFIKASKPKIDLVLKELNDNLLK